MPEDLCLRFPVSCQPVLMLSSNVSNVKSNAAFKSSSLVEKEPYHKSQSACVRCCMVLYGRLVRGGGSAMTEKHVLNMWCFNEILQSTVEARYCRKPYRAMLMQCDSKYNGFWLNGHLISRRVFLRTIISDINVKIMNSSRSIYFCKWDPVNDSVYLYAWTGNEERNKVVQELRIYQCTYTVSLETIIYISWVEMSGKGDCIKLMFSGSPCLSFLTCWQKLPEYLTVWIKVEIRLRSLTFTFHPRLSRAARREDRDSPPCRAAWPTLFSGNQWTRLAPPVSPALSPYASLPGHKHHRIQSKRMTDHHQIYFPFYFAFNADNFFVGMLDPMEMLYYRHTFLHDYVVSFRELQCSVWHKMMLSHIYVPCYHTTH